MARAVADPVEGVLGLAHRAQHVAHHGDVVALAVGADEVGLARHAAREDRPDGRAVVLGVDPVADVPPVAVELRAYAGKDVRYLPGDELLHVLVGAAVVGGSCRRSRTASPPRPTRGLSRSILRVYTTKK